MRLKSMEEGKNFSCLCLALSGPLYVQYVLVMRLLLSCREMCLVLLYRDSHTAK